jgi:gliding motility-associated-like protein
MNIKLLFFTCFSLFIHAAIAQKISHTYRFYENLEVAQPECGPNLEPAQALGFCNAGSSPGAFVKDNLPCGIQRSVYHNSLNWGLSYPNTEGAITDNYTIQMYVKVTDWGKTWTRIIDFSNGVLDEGVYFKDINDSEDRCMDFYPSGIAGQCPFFNNDEYYLLTFTRNGQSNIMDVYVNNVLFVSFNDTEERYVGKTGTPIYIFRDDESVTCESGEANFAYLLFDNQNATQTDVNKVYSELCFVANINPYADFSISPNPSCGIPQSINIQYTGNIPTPGTGYTFTWDWDGGKVISGSGMGPYVVSWDNGGTKNITLTVTNTSCGNSLLNRKQAIISDLNMTTSLLAGSCESNTEATLTVNAADGLAPYQYSIDSVNFQNDNVFKLVPAVYNVYVKDANNCTVKKEVKVELQNNLTVKTIADASICAGQTVNLTTSSNAQAFSWSPQDGLDNPNVKDPVASPAVTTQYIVTAGQGNCIQKDTVTISVVSSLELIVTPDTTVDYNVPFQLAVSSPQISNAADGIYLWSPPIGLNNPSSPNPITILQEDQTYTIDVTTGSGCTGSASVNLHVRRNGNISMPTAFTPDGDGKNEVLTPLAFNIAAISFFRVYNRWGQVVFYTNQLGQGWDGTYKGAKPVGGYYVWEIEGTSEDGKTIRKKGAVLLIR